MKRRLGISLALGILSILFFTAGILGYLGKGAEAAPSGAILIGQVKITSSNGQFVTLYNNTSADIDMSSVQLAYYNYYDLTSSKLTSSKYISLSGKLPAGGYYLVSDGTMLVCYKMAVNSVSLGFSSTAGTLQVVQNGPGNVLDSVAWSKTAVSSSANVQTLPSSTGSFLERAWVGGTSKTANDPWIVVTPSTNNACDLETEIAASNTPVAADADISTQTVKNVAASTSSNQNLNQGLVAPEITELFPNPAAPQTDDADEFIELYNPNNSEFNLTGYRLEVGTNYSRGYTFSGGNLPGKSYTAFMITDTKLQLSNSDGQARMLAPDGTTISETAAYEDAPDGQSFSMIGDSWQWTNKPTPNAPNQASESTDSTSANIKTSTAKSSSGGSAGSTNSGGGTPNDLNDITPLHPAVLAGVGGLAVAYALYEYRKDMANTLFKFRRYLKNRRTARVRV